MVQRKVISKLGIGFQADGDQLQQQDGKNRGTYLKKKMKKSGSLKRHDFEKLRLPNMGRQERQPGKPPPPAATPQKQPGAAAVETSTSTPNYMKSTSSSEARKEPSQVSSSRSSKTSPETLYSRRKSSGSSRILSKILTKTPSFKPARSSANKCSPVVLCENLDVKRSTCSSTLKSYKFPSYLSLNPGGTESDGTSVTKVCSYNYCSLNGHKHAPVPPLKKFLSARRLMIKTQRGLKLGCLSPRRSRPAGDGLTRDELDSSTTISPLIQEEDGDFYVEIYGVKKEDGSEQTRIDQSTSDEHEEENEDEQLFTDRNSNEDFDKNGGDAGAAEEINIASMAEEVTKLGCLRVQTEIMRENVQSVQSDELDSDASDMDWEAGEYSAFYLDDDHHDYSLKGIKECDRKGVDSSEVDSCIIREEAISNPDCCVSSCFDEIPADKESWSSESTGSYEYLDNFNTEITSFLFEDQLGNLVATKEDKTYIASSDLDSVSNGYPNEKYEHGVCSPYQSDTANVYPLDGDAFNGGTIPICEDPETDQYCYTQAEISSSDNGNGEDEKDQSDAANLTGIEASDEEFQTRNAEYQADNFGELIPMDPEEGTCLDMAGNEDHIVQREAENSTKSETKDTCKNLKASARCKRSIDEYDESRQFNPREPNFLPVEPDPEAEKVDLKHQMMDERKNSEEWMLDYALRQAVTTLAPARKRKVALLVEAFEKVLPFEPHRAHSSAALDHARPIQACR